MKTATTALERVAIALASLALSVGLIALLSGYFTGHDPADVAGTATGPGQAFGDQGHAALRPGAPHPAYDSSPPTSGPHVPLAQPVAREGTALTDDQLLQALQDGDVVLMYGGSAPPAGLPALARALAAPFSPALAATGQAIVLARRPGLTGITGLAWTHLIRVARPSDPALRAFAAFWLGRGTAPG